MKNIEFYKISGSGNDFIIMDNRDSSIKLSPSGIASLCARHTGAGADGLILLNYSQQHDFAMQYFNSDGYEAGMCGNGGRSIALFAYMKGIVKKREMIFQSADSVHEAYIKDNNIVRIQLAAPHSVKRDMEIDIGGRMIKGDFINTGVPHFVMLSDDIENEDVRETGRSVRMHQAFAPNGTNANFIAPKNDEFIIRTYERGVEDETLACGTGTVASAISAHWHFNARPPLQFAMRSGELLTVDFDSSMQKIYLEGRVTPVYRATLLFDV